MTRSYRDAAGFRRALEDRLKCEATARRVALDRLRKQVAYERFLARLARVAPPRSWALKGGLALIARLGERARATKDADATWRRPHAALEEPFEDVMECSLDDHFAFEIGGSRALEAEGPAGGYRYTVVARLAGRVFEQLQLDINVVVDDPRDIERVPLPSLLGFAGFAPVEIPMIRIQQHLAEKLHAYCRDYRGEVSGRPKDLFDMLRIAEHVLPCDANALRAACRETFALRTTAWPPAIDAPPGDWRRVWSEYIRDYGLRWTSLDAAYVALREFWEPVMTGAAHGRWEPSTWAWHTA